MAETNRPNINYLNEPGMNTLVSTIMSKMVEYNDNAYYRKNVTYTQSEINSKLSAINNTISSNKDELNNSINDVITNLSENYYKKTETYNQSEINSKISTINNSINNNKTELNRKIDDNVASLNEKINTNNTDINDRVDELSDTVDTNNTNITKKVNDLTTTVNTNNTNITKRVDDLTSTVTSNNTNLTQNYYKKTETYSQSEINSKLSSINNTISGNKTDVNDSINDVITNLTQNYYKKTETYNKTEIDNKVTAINNTINTNKTDVNNSITSINSKIANLVKASSTNGKINVNGSDITVYTHPSGTNPHGTTKADVGLSNVGNFKAVSTVASQGLNATEQSNARSNINAFSASGGTIGGATKISGNLSVTGTITGSAVYNAVWNADYAEVFDYTGKKPEVGEIIELAGDRKVKVAGSSSKVVGICSDSYCILAGGKEDEVISGRRVAVGLVGCLNIKVEGKVEYGDYIVCSHDGIGIVDNNAVSRFIIARALESNDNEDIKNVYCIIKSF